MGVQLRAFTLAHAYALMVMDSPWLTCAVAPSLDDLAVAVWVCSRDCYPLESVVVEMGERGAVRWMKRLGKRWDYRRAQADFDAFAQYITDYSETPDRFVKDSARRLNRVPWPLAVATALIRGGFDARSAWTMPLNQAFAHKLAADFLDGDDSLLSEEEAGAINYGGGRAKGAA